MQKNMVKELWLLERAGKVHASLMSRLRWLALLALLLLGFTAYEMYATGARAFVAFLVALAAGAIGYLFLMHSPVRWNEAERLAEVERMTIGGFAVLALLIILKVGFTILLARALPEEVQAYLVAACFGFIAGRMYGIVEEILRLHQRR